MPPLKLRLPKPIQSQIDEAERIEQALQREMKRQVENRPRPGPIPKEKPYKTIVVLQGTSNSELAFKAARLRAVCGPRQRGNKRLAKLSFIADLLDYYDGLLESGAALPETNLSADACTSQLLAIFLRHGIVPVSVTLLSLQRNTALRRKLSKRLAPVLRDIAFEVRRLTRVRLRLRARWTRSSCSPRRRSHVARSRNARCEPSQAVPL